MAEKQIAWASGEGYITVTFGGDGNGSVSVVSNDNTSFDAREQYVTIRTLEGTPERSQTLLIKQEGKRLEVGTQFKFSYTGAVQEVTLPAGRYKLQCWGAQGGSVTGSYAATGSKGGYSEGILQLTSTKTLYIFVGGRGVSYTSSASQTSTSVVNGGWNGGGAGRRTSRYDNGSTDGRSFPRGGGGATDIALETSSMNYSSGRTTRSDASLKSRIIVAGGGAGASARYTIETTTTTVDKSVTLGSINAAANSYNSGLGLYYAKSDLYVAAPNQTIKATRDVSSAGRYMITAYNSAQQAIKNTTNVNMTTPSDTAYVGFLVFANTQGETVKGTLSRFEEETTTSTSESSGKSSGAQQGGGTRGKGQYPASQSSAGSGGAFGLGASVSVNNYRYSGGAGGGGWYGGGTGHSDSSVSYVSYSGGGSGFVNTSANASYRPSGYSGLQLESGTTTAGSSSHPSTSGGTETGHSGDGYAIITVL